MIFDTWNLLLPVGVGVDLVLKKYKDSGINKELSLPIFATRWQHMSLLYYSMMTQKNRLLIKTGVEKINNI
jgi:hypothetical protein